jgi:prepilin-type N-terminal cleavage/methylation domain-containing protein
VPSRSGACKCVRGRLRQAGAGFTILELLVALAAVSVAATAAVTAYFSCGDVTLDNAARLLIDDLHQAQIHAVARVTPVEVRFHPDGSGYRIVDAQSALGAGSEIERCYPRDAVFEGVWITAVRIGGASTLTYDGNGTTRQSGEVTLSYRGEQRTVFIEQPSGTIQAPDLDFWALPVAQSR